MGISNIYINCSIISIINGLIFGLDILASNAYGARKYGLLGYYYHRAQLISYFILILLLIVHYFYAVKILKLLNIKKEILFYVEKYIYLSLIYCFLDIQFCLNFRYLNIIDKSHFNLTFLLITLILHPLWCYIFMIIFDLRIEGAALALILSQSINCLMGCIYIYIIKPLPESIFMFNKFSFKGWLNYLKISIPSTVLMCAEWWAFEILSIIAATLPQDDFTVHLFTLNISLNSFTVSIGFGICISIISAREFGKGDIQSSKNYLKTTYFCGISIALVVSLLIFFFKNVLFNLLVNEKNLAEKSYITLRYLSLTLIFDVTQHILSSFLKGIGKQWLATAISFLNFYGIQITLALIFTKVLDLGVSGIWLGLFIAAVFASLLYFLIYLRLDFNKVLILTQKRIEEDHMISLEKQEKQKDEI